VRKCLAFAQMIKYELEHQSNMMLNAAVQNKKSKCFICRTMRETKM